MKWQALVKAYEAFCTSSNPERRSGLERFRERGGAPLRRFACFELLREHFGSPWSKWPDPWRAPSDALLDRLYADKAEQAGLSSSSSGSPIINSVTAASMRVMPACRSGSISM